MVMKKTTPAKQKCVLLDACIIIEAFNLGVWESLIERAEVLVSSIVAHEETLFHVKGRLPEPINMKRLIAEGKVQEFAATASQMAGLRLCFDRRFVEGLHEGELEALALIHENLVGEALYSSGDANAIRALAMLGHSDRGISMERLLKTTGLQKTVAPQFGDSLFRRCIGEGKQSRITGEGLNKSIV